ncbi:MAG: argininosuccinate lyase [Paenibacillaceae bacterium]|nr:argininosuccinate lyase [Paenibacillaceae bacterium]
MKMWSGRFTKETNALVEQFTASIHFDRALFAEDIQGSIAHVRMLGMQGILPEDDVECIVGGLRRVYARMEAGDVDLHDADEDIHMAVEKMLCADIGPVGGKLHTGRSRNDQVATDMHLYVRRHVHGIVEDVCAVQRALLDQATAHIETLVPGYTHLQRAQPISLAHHFLAYVSMYERDVSRLIDAYKRIDVLPLGAGALAGTTFPIDRHAVAHMLGFGDVYDNSLDAVSDRDFVIELLSIVAMIMMHCSRLCEELVLWSSTEFSFIELDDAFCTGSSMMPQKKNPDVAELVRGKTGRLYGHLVALLTTMKGLPLAYNKDMQEDKEGMFDAIAQVRSSLRLIAPMIATMHVRTNRMDEAVTNDYANATDLADSLARHNVPFRQAHEIVGKLVLHAIEQKKMLHELPLETFLAHSPVFTDAVYDILHPRHVVDARDSYGGTAIAQVRAALARARTRTNDTDAWLHAHWAFIARAQALLIDEQPIA